MKVSLIAAAVLAVGLDQVVARSHWLNPKAEVAIAKSYYYKQIAKMFLDDDDDQVQCKNEWQFPMCCMKAKEGSGGWRQCFYAPPDSQCKHANVPDDDVDREKLSMACCSRCLRIWPPRCGDCDDVEGKTSKSDKLELKYQL